MRTLIRVGAVSTVAAAALIAAPSAYATPPGDNGTVKIHDASTDEALNRNEPHVCAFYLDAFGFDAGQQVVWHIEAWEPTAAVKGETVKSGEFALDADGHGRTADLSLPDGHYKLFWNFAGEKGAGKHKLFWADCEDAGGGGSTPSSSVSPSSSASASASASASTSASPSASASSSTSSSASASASPSAGSPVSAPASSSAAGAPSPQGGGDGGGLAETGSSAPVGLLSGVAAALVGAGGLLVLRRRWVSRG